MSEMNEMLTSWSTQWGPWLASFVLVVLSTMARGTARDESMPKIVRVGTREFSYWLFAAAAVQIWANLT